MDENKSHVEEDQEKRKPTSMSTLIIWNISKALEKNPRIDLKCAIKAAQERMERHSRGLNSMISEYPEERHLACALLAWQQLGHTDADSLYRFVETKRNEREPLQSNKTKTSSVTSDARSSFNKESKNTSGQVSLTFDTYTMGPVVKLPLESKIVMRLENTSSARHSSKRQNFTKREGIDRDTVNKIDEACCLDSECVERLTAVDAATMELRTRAGKLARREAERVELLERAETAWKDLELGYQRRLSLAEEKDEDMTKQIKNLIEERNGYKNVCTTLVQQLKERSEIAEKKRARLTQVEKEVCERACIRMNLSEQSARGDTTLADHQCKAAQLDRDLQFKEEQARRKMLSLESEVESARALALEAERAMREELGALREQIELVSKQLLEEDEANGRIKKELDELRKEKMEMVEDLEGCKLMCENRMQGTIDELKKKRERLTELKDTVMECRCKLPIDVTVEAKRTPSLAALCRCTPEDAILESCSCASLRSTLMSNLLADLFGGLQAELGESGLQMPCQLLKCLEDKHNWDRASIAKTNLRNYFSQLLIGELDIAIATSIEKYHATWVGASCADQAKLIPDPGEVQNEGWQERALERRAQKLATKLAEQLFQERAEKLVKHAKDIAASGSPPCECKPESAAVYSCTVKTHGAMSGASCVDSTIGSAAGTPTYWRRTLQDVKQLRIQIEDLRKDSVKKEDLKLMEENLAKIVKQTSEQDNEVVKEVIIDDCNHIAESTYKKENKPLRLPYQPIHFTNKTDTTKKKRIDTNGYAKKGNNSFNLNTQPDKSAKTYKRQGQLYAVNLCLCSAKTDPNKVTQQGKKLQNASPSNEPSWKHKLSKDTVPHISSIKQTKPINTKLPSKEFTAIGSKRISAQPFCQNDCICFHKVPTSTSIDKLLETLAKWKGDLTEFDKRYSEETENNASHPNGTKVGDMHDIKHENLNESVECSQKSEAISNTKKAVSDSIRYSNLSNEVDKKSVGLENIIPATTESEYMGTINLEKSHEDFCEYGKKNNAKYQEKNSLTSDYPFKCINSAECGCKKSRESYIEQSKSKLKHKDNSNTDLKKKENISEGQEEPPKKVAIIEDSGRIEMGHINEKNNEKSDRIAKIENFSCDCDYYIKFLGVTLANGISQNHVKKSIKYSKSNHRDNKDYPQSNDEKLYTDRTDKVEGPKSYNDREGNKKYTNEDKDLNFHSVDDDFVKPLKNKDAQQDVQKFEDNVKERDSCVYCKRLDVSQSNDLEVNAFHLLEEHLKRKLEDFKLSSHKSSLIPSDIEENLFTTILQKVKQLIADSTNQITCRCSTEKNVTEGSWNRAYGLLQEYLKMKIKRVECLCVSSKDSADVVLPGVLDKISSLIEHDFQCLKSLCKSDNIHNQNSSNKNVPYFKQEIPEKDTNMDKNISQNNDKMNVPDHLKYDNDKLSQQISNKSIIITQNISSQVPLNLGMENKSCNAMEKCAKDVQTTETATENTLNANRYCKVTEFKSDCKCTSKENAIPFFELSGTNEVLVNHCTDLMKNDNLFEVPVNVKEYQPLLNNQGYSTLETEQKFKENKTFGVVVGEKSMDSVQISNIPYIGYTIDCSCDFNLGSCVCTKSIVQANNDKINNTWNTFIANNSHLHKLSYIMNRKPVTNINDNIDFFDDLYLHNIFENNYLKKKETQICETAVSVNEEEDVILKHSNENINKIINNTTDATNTLDRNASLQLDKVLNNDAQLDRCDSGSNLNVSGTNIKNNAQQNSSYISISAKNRVKSEKNVNLSSLSQNCECDMVPICHVKMLVENIENKLVHSMCTCDSLIPNVCPVHSVGNY